MRHLVFALAMSLAASFASTAATLDAAATDQSWTDQADRLNDRLEAINTASWPLLVEGASFCQVGTAYRTGIDAATYEDDVPGRSAGTYAISVAADSPAAAAGVQRNDRIISINGDKTRRRFRGLSDEDLQDMLTAGSPDPMAFVVERDGETLSFDIAPVEVCDLSIEYLPGKLHVTPNSGNVVIVTDLVFEVAGPAWQQRAFIAPDMAYAMSETRTRNDIIRKVADIGGGLLGSLAGVERLGTAVNLGSRLALNKDQALKADRVSLFLLARTGVDITLVPAFWTSVYNYPDSDAWDRTYFGLRPTLAEREEVFASTLDEIAQLQSAGLPLVPVDS